MYGRLSVQCMLSLVCSCMIVHCRYCRHCFDFVFPAGSPNHCFETDQCRYCHPVSLHRLVFLFSFFFFFFFHLFIYSLVSMLMCCKLTAQKNVEWATLLQSILEQAEYTMGEVSNLAFSYTLFWFIQWSCHYKLPIPCYRILLSSIRYHLVVFNVRWLLCMSKNTFGVNIMEIILNCAG